MEEQTTQPQPKKNKGIVPVIGIALVAIAAVAYGMSGDKEVVPATTGTPTETTSNETVTPAKQSVYRDGTYNATGVYTSPGGAEKIGVTLTLKGDVITAAEVQKMATIEVSVKMQTVFADNYKQQVIGKNISEVKLDKVSGSSLTPKGFNDAVAKIKVQAQS